MDRAADKSRDPKLFGYSNAGGIDFLKDHLQLFLILLSLQL